MNKLCLTLFLLGSAGLCNAELIRNGSFEAVGPDKLPQHWLFTAKGSERAQPNITLTTVSDAGAPAGETVVRFTHPAAGVNDVYGSLTQLVRPEAGRRYRLNFYMKGKNINQLLLIFGARWAERWVVPTAGLSETGWKLFSYEITIDPQDLDPNGDYQVRFNIEGYAEWGMLDGVSFVPTGGSVAPGRRSAAPQLEIRPLPAAGDSDLFAADLILSGLDREAGWTLPVEITDAAGKLYRYGLKELNAVRNGETLTVNAILPLEIAAGEYAVKLPDIGSAKFTRQPSRAPREIAEQKERLARARARFAALEPELAKYPRSRYLAVYANVIPQQIELQGKDLNRRFGSAPERDYYLNRGRIAIPEIETALDDLAALLRSGKPLPGSWKLASGEVEYRDGFPVAEMIDEQGNRQRRYVMFGGYGHFEQAIRDMPLFDRIGGNVVQFEIGPWSVYPQPGRQRELEPDFTYYHDYIEAGLKRAQENNQKVALLLATHYVPEWFKKAHPETDAGHLFVPLDILHPATRSFHRQFIRDIVGKLAKSPYRGALHSIVLSNEPTYGQCTLDRSFSRAEFEKHLKRRYGSVAGFNRAAGTRFGDFRELADAGYGSPAVKHEFIRFKREALAGWHSFMASEVRRLLPGVPLQAKLMIHQVYAERELEMGLDPERFAAFSDLNGNDNGDGTWLDPSLGTALQYSLKPVSVANTENHYISDGSQIPVEPQSIYTSLFQQYMHGASTLVGWVWADNAFNGAPWLDGCIQRRPLDIIAHSRAILDANRLSAEIVAFNRVPPEAALIYSPTSLTLNRNRHTKAVYDTWRTLSATGRKLGFISEKQLAARKFGKLRVIVAPEVRNLKRDALAGLHEFVRRGGTVLTAGENFHGDEFGRPAEVKFGTVPANSRETLRAELARRIPLPVEVSAPAPADSLDIVQVRTVTLPDGRILVNLVNFDRSARRVKLDVPGGGSAVDLISGEPVPREFSLAWKTPMLIEIR